VICLSFDTDHLDEARMDEVLAEIPIPGSATFFCTQHFPALDPDRHELCPHPHLRLGEDWEAELDLARESFPTARGIRPHSALNSHLLSVELRRRGFEWTSARDEPGRRGIAPYREAWGLWHVPIYYMDNMDFSFADFWPDAKGTAFARELLEVAVEEEGVYVFDFHPVHLLLNTSSAEAYLSKRDRFLEGAPTDQLRSSEYGARDFYGDLVSLMEEAGQSSVRISDAVAAATGEAVSPARRDR
jgi:hypothetical protein